MQARLREPNEGIRRSLIGMVVLWVAAIVLAAVALTRLSPPPTSLRPASPPIGASALPATPEPSISPAGPAPTGVLLRTGPAVIGTRYPPGEPPGDVEDDAAPPPRSAPAPAKPTLPVPTLPPLPVGSIAPPPIPAI